MTHNVRGAGGNFPPAMAEKARRDAEVIGARSVGRGDGPDVDTTQTQRHAFTHN